METLASRAALIAAVWVAGCGGSTERCRPIDDPDGLWPHAALVRVDVYGAGASCSGSGVAGDGGLLASRSFSPGQPIALDLPSGRDEIVVTLFADTAGRQPIGAACTDGDFAAGSATCLALSLQPIPDGSACNACPAGRYCIGGECTPGCSTNDDCVGSGDGNAALTCCGHRCVDTTRDTADCGACGVTCSSANATPTCTNGACAWKCRSGFAHCGGDNTGCETNLEQAGVKPCGGTCVPTTSCCTAPDCTSPPGPAACYAAACSTGGACTYALQPGGVVCGATCCQSINGTCGAGCTLACDAGFADCDSDAANGCEQSLSTTSACGSCSNACSYPGGLASCSTGSCALAGCKSGFANCDGQAANGCECMSAGCCPGGACQQTHTNGLGQSYYDCTAPGTYNAQQALEACTAFTGDATQCDAITCSSGDLAVCSDGSSSSACDCWIYSGSQATRVKTGGKASCSCSAHTSSPMWN